MSFGNKQMHYLLRNLCFFLLIQSLAGKSIGILEDGYQEIIEEPNTPKAKETKYIEVDHLSDETLEEICKDFKVTIYIRDTDSVIQCLGSFYDDTINVHMVKRNAIFEGSGDDENQETESTEKTTITQEVSEISSTTFTPSINMNDSTSGIPTLFQNGFDHILKNLPSTTSREGILLKEGRKLAENTDGKPKLGISPLQTANEIVKTGESQENTSSATTNSTLLIVFAVLGVIGTLAFAYNFIQRRKEKKEIDEVIELEKEGKELKEMKPLMKNPLIQNGAKSLEYIDADPHDGTEIQVEINERTGH